MSQRATRHSYYYPSRDDRNNKLLSGTRVAAAGQSGSRTIYERARRTYTSRRPV